MKSVQLFKGEEVEIGTTDRRGNALKQSDFVVTHNEFEGISICQILYNAITKEFVAMSTSNWWIPYKDLSVATEKLDHVIAKEFLGLESCWYITVNKQIYSEERLGIAACLAAISSVRKQ